MTSNAHQSRWNIPSAVTSSSIFGYSSDGWKFGNASSYSTITYNTNVPLDFAIEWIVTGRYGTNPCPIGVSIGGSYIYINFTSLSTVNTNVGGSSNGYTVSMNYPIKFRLELYSTSMKLYVDDNLIATKTHSLSGNYVPSLQCGSNRWIVIKDYKIKPL